MLRLITLATVLLPVLVRAASPNLVLIIADDMAWDDCTAYGHKTIKTPNLSRLASEGMRFDRAFLTCSSCSPSRSSIITGRYPHSTGAMRLHEPLPGDQVTFVEILKASGYWTGQAGKWHLGPATKPKFDVVNEGGGASGADFWLPTMRKRDKTKPFFLWLASFDPHRPYEPNTIPVPHKPEEVVVPPYLPDTLEVRKDLAMYYDEISRLDSNVGKVLDELEAQKVVDNTLVLFISDNGRPFPRCKTTIYESGVKTPLIIRWPGHIKTGSTCTSLVSSIDIAPTFLELAGQKAGPTFQGTSFAALFSDPTKTIRQYAHSEHNWHDFDDHGRAVRSLDFIYIRNYYTDLPNTPPADAVRSPTFQAMRKLRDEGKLTPEQMNPFNKPRPPEELYDTKADPNNFHNLASDPNYTAKLAEMREELQRWEKSTKDSIPEKRTPDGFDRETGNPIPGARRGARKEQE